MRPARKPNRTLTSLAAISIGALALALVVAGCGEAAGGRAGGAPARAGSGSGSGSVELAATAPAVAAPAGTVTAQGTGSVTGEPDTLTATIGVSTTAAHAATALAENNTLAASVQAVLERDGVSQADVQTTNLSLQQNWSNSGPSGYAVADEVTATIHKLSTAGTVIDDALGAAGDSGRLEQVNLSFRDTDPLMAAARTQAVQSAESQAAQMASASGNRLGVLESLTAAPQAVTYPQMSGGAMASASSGTVVPVQPGTQDVSVQVTGVWQLIPAG